MSDAEQVETTEAPAEDKAEAPEFTPEEIAKYKELRAENAERRKENEQLAKELAKLRKDQERAQQAELAEQGKWKEIADQATAKVAELETSAEAYKKMGEVIGGLLETQRAGLPESVTTLLDKLDPVEQLEWLGKYKTETQSAPEPEQTNQQKNKAALSPFNPTGGQVKENDAQRMARLQRLTSGSGPFG